jgi:hypothetical protein
MCWWFMFIINNKKYLHTVDVPAPVPTSRAIRILFNADFYKKFITSYLKQYK